MKKTISSFLMSGKDTPQGRFFGLDSLALISLIVLFSVHDPFGINKRITDFLRLNFFIFTREPKLLLYSQLYLSSAMFKIISLSFVVFIVLIRKIPFKELFLSLPERRLSGTFWFLFTLACFCLHLLNINNPLRLNIPFNSVFPEAFILGNLIIIFAVIFIAPLVEEIIFRGFLYPSLNKYMGKVPAIFLVSVLFTLAHYPQIMDDKVFMSAIFFLSVLITYIRARTGSTWYAIVMHFIYNLTHIIVGFAAFLVVRY